MQNEFGQDNREPPAYPIGSVDSALKLLKMLAYQEEVRVSDAAAVVGTARSTAHRLLAMLEYHGLALKDQTTKSYRAGPELLSLGLAAVQRLDLRQRARPVLERLCIEVGETVHLAGFRDSTVVFLDAVETSKALRVGSRIGRVMPAHCTAGGKAILAQLSPDALHELYRDDKLEKLTPRSIASLSKLNRELSKVRELGYATSLGESEAEVASVAVAIPNQPSNDLAAITVSAPLTRMDEAHVRFIAEAAMREAAKLGIVQAA